MSLGKEAGAAGKSSILFHSTESVLNFMSTLDGEQLSRSVLA